jgi:lysophospholipase L1-like esterase
MKRLCIIFLIGILFNSCGLLKKTSKTNEINVFKAKYNNREPITIGIIGNSIGCGFRANNTFPSNETKGKMGLLGECDNLDKDGRLTETGQYDLRIRSWAVQLNEYLKKKNKKNCIQNMSASGWDIRHHIADKTVEKIALRVPKPDIILIPLQINDSKGSVADYNRYLDILVQQIRALNMIPVIVKENAIDPIDIFGVNGINSITHRSPERRYFYSIMNAVDTIAIKENIEVVDFFSPTKKIISKKNIGESNTSGIMWDYLHPNQAGHDLMFSIIKKWMKN